MHNGYRSIKGYLRQEWSESHVQVGVYVQGIGAGEGKTHRRDEGPIVYWVDEQNIGVDGMCAVGLKDRGWMIS